MVSPNDIEVKSYRDYAIRGAWGARGASLWAFSALGLATGAALGLLAPIFPAVAGAELAAGFLWKSVAIFSAAGMAAGFGAASFVGSSAGAAADVAKEQEKRMLAHEAEIGLPVSKDGLAASTIKPQKNVNLKVGAMMAGVGMIGGAVMFAAFMAMGGVAGGAVAAIPGLTTLLGTAVSNTAVASYFIGTMGLFGAIWTFNFPQIAYKISDFANRYIGGSAINASWDLPKEQQKEPEKPVSVTPVRTYEQTAPIQARRSINFREMLEQQEQSAQAIQR